MPDGQSEPAPSIPGSFASNVLPALLWAVAIFVGGGSGVPQPWEGLFSIPVDKVEHALAFCGLQVLGFRALRHQLPAHPRPALLWLAALLSVMFGIALEIYQYALPDRSADVLDAAADALGALLGATGLRFTRIG